MSDKTSVNPPPADEDDPGYLRLIRALGHPLRAQILSVLQQRRASPSELADALGAPLGNVSYHVRVLAELKLIRHVKQTPRRGAIEHHYEAVPAAQVSGRLWAKLPALAKQAFAGAALAEIGRAVNDAASHGGFDRADVHMTRSRLVLDERGWADLAALLARTVEHAERIERHSQKRLRSADHKGELKAVLAMMLFDDRPGPEASGVEGSAGDHGCGRSERRADAPSTA